MGKARTGKEMTQSYLIKLVLLKLSEPKVIHFKKRGLSGFTIADYKLPPPTHNSSEDVDDGKCKNHLEKVNIRDQSDPFKY